MTKVEKYTQEALAIANDNKHGYSQSSRWGTPDYDCSSLVIAVVENAGIPVKSRGAVTTHNIREVFMACGFQNVTSSCNLKNGKGMIRGDILLNDESHVAIYTGNGKAVHARTSEGNPQAGDQTGNEIREQAYWNYPWTAVLRYPQENADTEDVGGDGGKTEQAAQDEGSYQDIKPDISFNNKNYPEILKFGDCGEEVKDMQNKLNAVGYNCGTADGIFGKNTLAAVQKFQAQKGLLVDGEAGPITLGKLDEIYADFYKTSSDSSKKDAKKAGETEAPKPQLKYAIGDVVNFTGNLQYVGANFKVGVECKPGKARITAIREDAAHPYHLVKLMGGESNVYGWVNEDTITKE